MTLNLFNIRPQDASIFQGKKKSIMTLKHEKTFIKHIYFAKRIKFKSYEYQ